MNFRVSLLALVTLVVLFQNCGNVKFEGDGSKIVSKIGAELNSPNEQNGGGSLEVPEGNGPPEDNNNVPEYSEEELAAAACSDGSEQGYLICHFPTGNFEAFHTLCVGRGALIAHLRHGHSGTPGHPRDLLGSCEDNF